MNIQRLKFAFARGACFQWKRGAYDWHTDHSFVPGQFVPQGTLLRIHPEHAHLGYGPLSSELRRRAIEQDFEGIEIDWIYDEARLPLWEGIWAYLDLQGHVWRAATDDGRMFLLFLAELLADEGL